MTVQQQLLNEIEELPPDAQKKLLKLIHFIKKEMFVLPAAIEKGGRSGSSLQALDDIAIETGISDLASQHDTYLYGVPKK